MFSLSTDMRYWLYNKPVNMRLGFNSLTGIVNNSLGMSIRSGDVFVFVNASRNRIKILHKEDGGLVLYAMRVEMGRLRLPFLGGTDDIAGDFKYEDLIFMAKSAMESPYVRRMKMLSKSV